MYRRPKFLEVLLEIRQEMAREADYDTDLFAELIRSGKNEGRVHAHTLDVPETENVRVGLQKPARE
ncbi:MAG: hypothetical protein LC730_01365 [Acidobacteria bacterium]|nr:hypothetical protein [Acidobacteriota bacterium]